MNHFSKCVFKSVGLACLAGFALSSSLRAGMTGYLPISANEPALGPDATYTGVAQSFTAQDPNVLFGFYIENLAAGKVNNESLASQRFQLL